MHISRIKVFDSSKIYRSSRSDILITSWIRQISHRSQKWFDSEVICTFQIILKQTPSVCLFNRGACELAERGFSGQFNTELMHRPKETLTHRAICMTFLLPAKIPRNFVTPFEHMCRLLRSEFTELYQLAHCLRIRTYVSKIQWWRVLVDLLGNLVFESVMFMCTEWSPVGKYQFESVTRRAVETTDRSTG